jgi:hypothetical protein
VARADFVGEQEKRLPWSTTPQSLFDAFAEKICPVPQGYGENRSFLRRESLMDIGSTGGFASITERFSAIPRSKSRLSFDPNLYFPTDPFQSEVKSSKG